MWRMLAILAAYTTFAAATATADDRVLYLKCKSPNAPNPIFYTTIDFGHGTAKASNEPEDERQWNHADISDIVVKWEEHYNASTWVAIFNRYSGSLEYLFKRSDGTLEERAVSGCDRAEPPRRKY